MTEHVGTRPVHSIAWRRRLGIAQDCFLAVVAAVFFVVHARAVADLQFTSVPFAVEQGLLAVLFLTRRRSRQTSTRLWDWVIAATSWLPLLARPVGGVSAELEVVGTGIQMMGLGLTIVGFSYLGRSFGVVAADRGLKIRGPYAIVRHPIYLSHSVTMGGFLIANPDVLNATLVMVTVAGMLLRLRAEEALLTRSAGYEEYRSRVRWRLLPGVY